MAKKKKSILKNDVKTEKMTITKRYEMFPVYSIRVNGRTYTSRNLTNEAADEYLRQGGKPFVFKSIIEIQQKQTPDDTLRTAEEITSESEEAEPTEEKPEETNQD
jgi:TPP-dependent pyruvate/acetoin dehydrogenase alpha subunit